MPEALDGKPGFADWLGGTPEPAVTWTGETVTFAWSHRDRLTQTSPVIADHTAGDIGPEPGTTYRLCATELSETGS